MASAAAPGSIPPYVSGQRIEIVDGDRWRTAVVIALVPTDSLEERRRWRVICLWDDDRSSLRRPAYCDGDGNGDLVRPLSAREAAAS